MEKQMEVPKANEPITMEALAMHTLASEQFFFIKQYIEEYEKTLDKDHEAAMLFTNFGEQVLMNVDSIACKNPVLLIFKGMVNGRPATLIQHISQLNFLLTTVEKRPNRGKMLIGFDMNDDD